MPLDVERMEPRLDLGGEPVEIYGTEEEMTTEDLEEVSADDILTHFPYVLPDGTDVLMVGWREWYTTCPVLSFSWHTVQNERV